MRASGALTGYKFILPGKKMTVPYIILEKIDGATLAGIRR